MVGGERCIKQESKLATRGQIVNQYLLMTYNTVLHMYISNHRLTNSILWYTYLLIFQFLELEFAKIGKKGAK